MPIIVSPQLCEFGSSPACGGGAFARIIRRRAKTLRTTSIAALFTVPLGGRIVPTAPGKPDPVKHFFSRSRYKSLASLGSVAGVIAFAI
jgi:hypothetical protein